MPGSKESFILPGSAQAPAAGLTPPLHAVSDLLLYLSADGLCLDFQVARFAQLLPPREFLGKRVLDVLPPRLAQAILAAARQALDCSAAQVVEYTVEAKEGKPRRFECRVIPCAGEEVLAYLHDVTEQRRDVDSQRQNEKLYRMLVEAASDVVYSVALADGRLTSLNAAFERVTGWPRAEWLGRPFRGLIHPDDLELALRTFERSCRGESPSRYELRVRHRDGHYVVGEFTSMPHEVDGRIIGEIGIARDVTQRRRAEQALRESEERYRRFFEEDLSGAFISTPDGRLLACNSAFARMFGFASVAEALQARADSLYCSPEAREEVIALLRKSGRLERQELELRHRSGRPLYVIENVTGRFDEAGELVEIHGFLMDNTERKRLEEQFLQSQKMEAVGRLAGGVAHDFNNLLTAILGYSDLLLSSVAPESPERSLLEEIAKAGERAAGLTRQLLAFSRKQVLRPQVIDLNRVIAGLEKMMRLVLSEKVQLQFDFQPDLYKVKADPGQIEQGLMNLIVNARDAMPRGGRLTITTNNVEAQAGTDLGAGELSPGPYARITVADTGCGISDEIKAHLFEPFFTTKEVGKGTGLGLATTYGIVTQSGGHITVDSAPERGASFAIYLPSCESRTPPGQSPAPLANAPRGTETLLLVEDEDGLRTLVRTILTRQGYRLLPARHAGDALTLCQTEAGRIDLLVTDVVMPGMGGRELADRLVQLRPALKVLFLSGYTDDAALRLRVQNATCAFLQKPFSPDELARKVRDVLDGTPTR